MTTLYTACSPEAEKIDPESDTYRQAVSDFYVSLAASQTDEARFAFNKMNNVMQAYPGEPAARANLGVYAMRQGNFELAEERLSEALDLMPESADILFLSGYLQSHIGNTDRAIDFFRRGAGADPDHLPARFALITEMERENYDSHAGMIRKELSQLHAERPENQMVLFELARMAARERDTAMLKETVDKLSEFSGHWSSSAREQLDLVKETTDEASYEGLILELSFLRNAIEPSASFQADMRQLMPSPNEVGYLITQFLTLPEPGFHAAEPDLKLTFDPLNDNDFPESATFVRSVTLLEDLPPLAVYMSDSRIHIDQEVVLDFPGNGSGRYPESSLAEIDYNYNFRNDLALAGNGGFRLYRQNDDRTFTDVTRELNLPESVTEAAYTGVWPADIDHDGDLDLILARENRGVVVLRNNSDGSFTRVELFSLTDKIIDFKWADLDGDGVSDALFLSGEGELHLYRNLRGGSFSVAPLPDVLPVSAMEIADLDGNGIFDIITVAEETAIDRIYYDVPADSWKAARIGHEPAGHESADMDGKTGSVSLYVSDLDNNGALDILVSTYSGSRIWLADSHRHLEPLDLELPGRVMSVFDISGNEKLDLIGITANGHTFRLLNSGSKDYGAQSVRARASGLEGDQRINSFGIGGEIEVRSGLHYQKQLINSPIIHFGLGHYQEAEMLRIIWPNGSVQTEFAELGMGSTIFNEQILKGSCPWLFTHDGDDVRFITDALWRSPLGLRINARETAGVVQTLDRVRIPGSKLAGRNGVYDVRITAELWETHFFDFVDLIAVDHPEGTEIFVDERFVFPAPDLSARAVNRPQPVASVLDENGQEVGPTVRRRDGNYLKTFTKTSYQGLVEDHFIEIDLGEDAPADVPLYLIASGWLRPTDSSINLALSQGIIEPPAGLKIEASDGAGGWELLHDDYGVPAGKLKTILLDLDGVFPDETDRRLRMHTTSEIYWDSFHWAERLSDDRIREQSLRPIRQELRYRGYSEWFRADSVSPKLPDYQQISSTAPRWRDLTGFHTRFGDVRELLKSSDDRYVIMNAGDELLLEFEDPGAPPEGWTRSFIFVSDGWVKDGDYNTEASKTVEPLPFHGQRDYDYQSEGTLHDDPVYQRYQRDWIDYHTRFITSIPFRTSLLFD